MKEICLTCWDEYQARIEGIKDKYGSHLLANHKVQHPVLYRGLTDARYTLKTTLERYSSAPWSVKSYEDLVRRCAPQVASYTGKAWDLPTREELEEELRTHDDRSFVHLPSYSFCVHLRHHGFPSPLLDWTMSPYVAAFFAFADQPGSSADAVAIFVYINAPRGGHGSIEGTSQISIMGPYVQTHKRHFLQQACYTVCTKHVDGAHAFTPHEDVFTRAPAAVGEQDLLFKITIPKSERLAALSDLREMNISRFSLFQTEEALTSTLAFEEIEKRGFGVGS